MIKLIQVGLLGAAMLGASVPALSHHSHSMFDHDQEVSLTGTVTKFTFRNPHVFLFLDVEDESGATVNYWVEMSNIPNMIRRGIGYSTFKTGDVVTVNIYPLRDGRPGGNYVTVIAADGTEYD
jgi:hypothetical protein